MTTKIISSIEIEALSKLYTIEKPDEVLAFLKENAFLVPTLLEAPAQIQLYFPETTLVLTFSRDPEYPTHSQLVVWISVSSEDKDVLKKLDVLDENWSIHLPDPVLEKFSSNLRFV